MLFWRARVAITRSRCVFRRMILVLCAAPNLKIAKKIACGLVERKLAACVSFHQGWISIYWWKGAVEQAAEVLVLIKTKKRLFSKVKKIIQSIHPYEVPEIVGIPIIRASAEYLGWMNKTLK